MPPDRMRTLDDEVNKHAKNFIRKAVSEDKPFFVWHCPARAHVWTYFSEKYQKELGKDGKGMQEVVMQELDDHVGDMLQLLKELGVDDNTIVVFTADNGPEMMTWPDGGTTPFKAEKGTTWEGGFRVPAVVKWPGKIKPGQRTNAIFDCKDWFPT